MAGREREKEKVGSRCRWRGGAPLPAPLTLATSARRRPCRPRVGRSDRDGRRRPLRTRRTTPRARHVGSRSPTRRLPAAAAAPVRISAAGPRKHQRVRGKQWPPGQGGAAGPPLPCLTSHRRDPRVAAEAPAPRARPGWSRKRRWPAEGRRRCRPVEERGGRDGVVASAEKGREIEGRGVKGLGVAQQPGRGEEPAGGGAGSERRATATSHEKRRIRQGLGPMLLDEW
ncbi:unnamed protein product [Urochloa humidicola]